MASKLLLLLLALCSVNMAQCGLRVYNLYARGLRPDPVGSADGFVEMSCGSAYTKTSVNENNANPSWTEELSYSRALPGDQLELRVYDKDVAFNDRLGVCTHSICNIPAVLKKVEFSISPTPSAKKVNLMCASQKISYEWFSVPMLYFITHSRKNPKHKHRPSISSDL